MSNQSLSFINELKNIVGEERVITDTEVLKQNSSDYIGYRRYEKADGVYCAQAPLCIVKPTDIEQVANVIKYLNENKLIAVPRTGGSSVTASIETPEGSVVVDGSDMNGIIDFDEFNMMVTVKCGTPLEYLEKYANDRGYTTGHFPQSLPMAHIGGLVATRSIGQFSTLYGGIEDLVVGLEAVLPDGEVVRIKNIPRRAAGPDIRHLFIGSEGAFAYITEITLKLFKHYPECRWMNTYTIGEMQEGLDIIREIMVKGYKPAVVRLHDKGEAQLKYNSFVPEGKAILLFIAEGPKAIADATGAAIDEIATAHGAVSIGKKPVEVWLVHRNDECAEMDDRKYHGMHLCVDTCEISANWSDIGKIYYSVVERVSREIKSIAFIGGHSSHSYVQGTNIYFMFGFVVTGGVEGVKDIYMKLVGIIMEETLKHNGSIAHHHGIGRYRTPWMKKEHQGANVLFEMLKETLDPNGIMNKGCLIP